MVLTKTGWFQGKLVRVEEREGTGANYSAPYLLLHFSVPNVVGFPNNISRALVSGAGSAKDQKFCWVLRVNDSGCYKKCIGAVVSVLIVQDGQFFNVDTILPGGLSPDECNKRQTQYEESIALRKESVIALRQSKKLSIKSESLKKQSTTLHSESERLLEACLAPVCECVGKE